MLTNEPYCKVLPKILMQNLLIDCYPPTCPASRVLMMVHLMMVHIKFLLNKILIYTLKKKIVCWL